MMSHKKNIVQSGAGKKPGRFIEIVNTLEGLITAFIMAFVIITFVVQSFVIPTGSMADTLRGDHYRLRCSQCGYQYEHNFSPERRRAMIDTRCPSCGFFQSISGKDKPVKGDKILVLKCVYQFFDPKRWDVVVFKNPTEPRINYIKRLVALPGETVEIIDGDVYINGRIVRKPPKVQDELWMPVYDNDYQPARKNDRRFNGHYWRQPFRMESPKWYVNPDVPTVFHLQSGDNQQHYLVYDSSRGNDFRAAYAYDSVHTYRYMPYCSDLMIRFYITPHQSKGSIGASLSKYGIRYDARVDFAGRMVITRKAGENDVEQLAVRQIVEAPQNYATLFTFANVDHQLILRFGGQTLSYDLGLGADDAGRRRNDIQPEVAIFACGQLSISHTAVFRDIHYMGTDMGMTQHCRAGQDSPFKLNADEFFMLGDNSPGSKDSRWWDTDGIGNNGLTYRQGVVPREYLLGRAFFVYWPSGFKPFEGFFGIIPNVGRMRIIDSGSNSTLLP
ncbi:MAG: signal peptidase I [Planctomycetota bacterium]